MLKKIVFTDSSASMYYLDDIEEKKKESYLLHLIVCRKHNLALNLLKSYSKTPKDSSASELIFEAVAYSDCTLDSLITKLVECGYNLNFIDKNNNRFDHFIAESSNIILLSYLKTTDYSFFKKNNNDESAITILLKSIINNKNREKRIFHSLDSKLCFLDQLSKIKNYNESISKVDKFLLKNIKAKYSKEINSYDDYNKTNIKNIFKEIDNDTTDFKILPDRVGIFSEILIPSIDREFLYLPVDKKLESEVIKLLGGKVKFSELTLQKDNFPYDTSSNNYFGAPGAVKMIDEDLSIGVTKRFRGIDYYEASIYFKSEIISNIGIDLLNGELYVLGLKLSDAEIDKYLRIALLKIGIDQSIIDKIKTGEKFDSSLIELLNITYYHDFFNKTDVLIFDVHINKTADFQGLLEIFKRQGKTFSVYYDIKSNLIKKKGLFREIKGGYLIDRPYFNSKNSRNR